MYGKQNIDISDITHHELYHYCIKYSCTRNIVSRHHSQKLL